MSKALFGAMAMFYAVGAGTGGAMTPSSFVGAAPQIKFGTAANQGFLSSDGATTGVSLSHAIDVVAGVDTATQIYGGRIRMNSATDFLVIDSQSSGLTPGVAASPTSRLLWAFGSYAQFSDQIITPALQITGGTTPSSGTSLAAYFNGGAGTIVARAWPSGSYQSIVLTAADFNFQTNNGSTSSFSIDGNGAVTQLHRTQLGFSEILYTGSVVDDATAKLVILNFAGSNNLFTPAIQGTTSGSANSFWFSGAITTDSGSTPAVTFDARLAAGGALATRPLFAFAANGTAQSTMLFDGSQWWGAAPNNVAAGGYIGGFRKTNTITSGTGNCFNVELYSNPAGASSATNLGAWLYATSSSGNGQNFTSTTGLVGARLEAQHRGTGTVTGAAALYPVITNSGGGTITNAYAIYIPNVSAGTNNYTLYGGGGIIDNVGTIRATGTTNPPSGQGTEILFSGGVGYLQVFDRAASYLPLNLRAATITLSPSGAAALTVDASRCTFAGGQSEHVTVITAAGPTTAAATDHCIILIPTVTATQTVNLPASPVTGQCVEVIDGKGIALTNTITIQGNGKNINGAASTTIVTNYGAESFIYNGTEWNIRAKGL